MMIMIAIIFAFPSTFSYSQMPAAITIEPANATAYDEMTLIFDPAEACFESGSLAGLDSIAMHSGITYGGNQWQNVIAFNSLGANGQAPILYPTGDGRFSITYTPSAFYGVTGWVVTEICAVFNNATDWSQDGRDFDMLGINCMDFFIPVNHVTGTIKHVPGDFPSIQEAIDMCNNGDTVLVDTGTYVENINFIGKNITVASLLLTTQDTSYISQTIIDGNQEGSVVTFENGEDAALLCGFTITNGATNFEGGGIYCANSNPTFNELNITYNTAENGGGVYCDDNSDLALMNVTINHNTAGYEGGGIFCKESSMTLDTVTFTSNQASFQGGGINAENSNLQVSNSDFNLNEGIAASGAVHYYNDENIMENYVIHISNSNFENNTTSGATGGVLIGKADENESSLDLKIDNCTFSDNSANRRCGLFINGEDISFTVSNCSFNNNEATTYVGAVSISNSADGMVLNSLFASNTGASGGGNYNAGGVNVWSAADVDLVNCTFADNVAAYGAGLTVGGGGIATATNCIFWGNIHDQIALDTYNNLGGTLTLNYSDIQYGIDSVKISPESTLNWGTGNTDSNPQFSGAGEHPYAITEGSPCIDAGTPDTTGLFLPPTDLAGNPRIWNGRIDMGAYEWNIYVGTDESLPAVHDPTFNIHVFPNPLSSEAVIEYELNESGEVSLTIYNHIGQRVGILINHSQQQGSHQVTWDASGFPAGLYFYKLQAGEQYATGKMIVVK